MASFLKRPSSINCFVDYLVHNTGRIANYWQRKHFMYTLNSIMTKRFADASNYEECVQTRLSDIEKKNQVLCLNNSNSLFVCQRVLPSKGFGISLNKQYRCLTTAHLQTPKHLNLTSFFSFHFFHNEAIALQHSRKARIRFISFTLYFNGLFTLLQLFLLKY